MLNGKVRGEIGFLLVGILLIQGLSACGQPKEEPTAAVPTETPTEVPPSKMPPVAETVTAAVTEPVPVVTEVTEEPLQMISGTDLCEALLDAPMPGYPGGDLDWTLGFQPGRFIFTGQAEDINDVITATNLTAGTNLALVVESGRQEVDLTNLLATAGIVFGDGSGTPVIRLYEDNQSPGQTIDTLQVIYETVTSGNYQVFADLNYLVASPWDVEGSPWDVEGSPWDVEGSQSDDFFVSETPDVFGNDSLDKYLTQRALAYIGQPYGTLSGEGAKVVIFDTSPFELPGVKDPGLENYKLCVVHPELPGSAYSNPGQSLLNQHGYFIGGLAYLTAPESDLYLIRALDKGSGDLFSVLKIMLWYMDTTCSTFNAINTTSACTKALSDTVFNLSFGFRPERVPILTEVEEAEYADLIAQMWTLVPDYYFGLLEPERFSELQGVMLGKQGTEMQIPVVGISLITVIANELGGRVAAAAGNSSAGIEGHRTPDIPARLFHVTGVASRSMIGDPALVDIGKQEEYNYLTLGNAPAGLESTFVPDPSGSIIVPPLTCYSNFGSLNEPDFDLFYPGKIVPGGNGYTEESSCVPSLSVCAAGNCLISTIYDPVRETYDFIYWAGTSFATPLYAGMVASGGAP